MIQRAWLERSSRQLTNRFDPRKSLKRKSRHIPGGLRSRFRELLGLLCFFSDKLLPLCSPSLVMHLETISIAPRLHKHFVHNPPIFVNFQPIRFLFTVYEIARFGFSTALIKFRVNKMVVRGSQEIACSPKRAVIKGSHLASGAARCEMNGGIWRGRGHLSRGEQRASLEMANRTTSAYFIMNSNRIRVLSEGD